MRMLKPDDRVVVYMRPGCHVCARVKTYLTERDVPFQVRDVDGDPLTPRELWELFNRKAGRLRVPFTALNDGEDVVLGFDPQRLEGVFVHGELGGVQVASAVTTPLVYDAFVSSEVDGALWGPDPRADPADLPGLDGYVIDTGHGELRIASPAGGGPPPAGGVGAGRPARLVSSRRFGTPPGSQVSFELEMAFRTDPRVAGGSGPAMGEMGLHDLPTGMVLGFELTNDAILAVHRRLGVPGVVSAAETFSHRVISAVRTAAGQRHRLRITYQHDTSRACWYVDDSRVYTARSPFQSEGFSLVMGAVRAARGDAGASVSWTPWRLAADTAGGG